MALATFADQKNERHQGQIVIPVNLFVAVIALRTTFDKRFFLCRSVDDHTEETSQDRQEIREEKDQENFVK